MNEARRIKMLKLRQRADRFEIEAAELRQRDRTEIEAANKRANRVAAEATAAIARAQNGSTETRQKIARLETLLSRAVEALEYLDPRAPIEGLESATAATVSIVGSPRVGWRELIGREDLWYAERGRMIKGEMRAAGLKRPEPGVPGFVTNDDGQSVSFFSAPAGSGGVIRPLRTWPDEQ